MRLTPEQIKERLEDAIEEVVNAANDYSSAEGFQRRPARIEYEETRKRVMDALIEIYIG